MKLRQRFVKRLALTGVVLFLSACAGPLAAQEKSWKGETVLQTKPAREIRFVDRLGEEQTVYSFSGIWPFTVREEKDGWLRIHDRYHEGWVSKADFVLAKEGIAYFSRRLEDNTRDSFALMMRGGAHWQKGELDSAIRDFDRHIELFPKSSVGYNGRGLVYRDKKELDKSLADFDEAVRLDPRSPVQYINRGYTLALKKEFDKAIADYDEVIRLAPRYANAWYYRGLAWSNKKEYDKAIADYDESIRLDPRFAPAFYWRGVAWRMKNDYDKAIKDYDQTVRVDPKYWSAFHARGVAYILKKEYDRAVKDLDEAIRLNPRYAFAFRERGVAHRNLKHFEKALADYESALRLDPKYSTVMADKAWLLATCPEERFRDGKKAVELARRANELSDYKIASHFSALAAAQAEAGDFKEAVRWQQKVLDSPDYMKQFGKLARERMKLYEAEKPYRESATPAPPKDGTTPKEKDRDN
jgi:tetratricopeptide (TPR) repeat protein